MTDPAKPTLRAELERQIADLERRYEIGPDKYCGCTPADIGRAVVAHGSGPRRPGEAVGYRPIGADETRRGWLREEFGPAADVERWRVVLQFFDQRVAEALRLDWQLSNEEFDRAVMAGLTRHYPELSAEARWVIAGNLSYSHAK